MNRAQSYISVEDYINWYKCLVTTVTVICDGRHKPVAARPLTDQLLFGCDEVFECGLVADNERGTLDLQKLLLLKIREQSRDRLA